MFPIYHCGISCLPQDAVLKCRVKGIRDERQRPVQAAALVHLYNVLAAKGVDV